jgi:hypothetical protein
MKSIETKFAEAMDALKKAGRTKQFDEKAKGCTTIEAKLNCAEDVLKAAGIIREQESTKPANKKTTVQESESVEDIEEVKRDCPFLFDVEPRSQATTKESAAPVRKHNGSAENFVEGSPFNGDRGRSFSAGYIIKEVADLGKGDKIMFDGLLKLGKITEAEHSKLTGAKPDGYNQLTEQQKKEFDFARLIGISESDAFRVAKMTGSNFREVSRR